MTDQTDQTDQVLRHAADLFHEIGSALSVEELLADNRNPIVAALLREKLRSPDQMCKIAADGFDMCLRALAEMGAPDVTIHECGAQALEPWSDGGA